MRSFRVDQFEFDVPDGEEALEIDISHQSKFPHPDLISFAGATIGVKAASAMPEPEPFYRIQGNAQVSEYLRRFANVEVPSHSDWPTYSVSSESWSDIHLVICAPGLFIRYHWSTSA